MIAELDALIETAEDYLMPSDNELPPPVAPLMGVAPAVVIALARCIKAASVMRWEKDLHKFDLAIADYDNAVRALASALAPEGDK